MPDKIMEFSSKGWMARSYRRFVEIGGRERNPENLCRFLRVCFLWAPIRRFFQGNAPAHSTPFGFCAFIALCTVMLKPLYTGIYYMLFVNWIHGLYFGWFTFFIISLASVIHWIDQEHGAKKLRLIFIEPFTAIQTYRKARASRFCPLVKIK